jgi:hypothetical protein
MTLLMTMTMIILIIVMVVYCHGCLLFVIIIVIIIVIIVIIVVISIIMGLPVVISVNGMLYPSVLATAAKSFSLVTVSGPILGSTSTGSSRIGSLLFPWPAFATTTCRIQKGQKAHYMPSDRKRASHACDVTVYQCGHPIILYRELVTCPQTERDRLRRVT